MTAWIVPRDRTGIEGREGRGESEASRSALRYEFTTHPALLAWPLDAPPLPMGTMRISHAVDHARPRMVERDRIEIEGPAELMNRLDAAAMEAWATDAMDALGWDPRTASVGPVATGEPADGWRRAGIAFSGGRPGRLQLRYRLPRVLPAVRAVASVGAVLAGIFVAHARLGGTRTRRFRAGRRVSCGDDLRPLDRCPECSRPRPRRN